jgi:hypothetical protein
LTAWMATHRYCNAVSPVKLPIGIDVISLNSRILPQPGPTHVRAVPPSVGIDKRGNRFHERE